MRESFFSLLISPDTMIDCLKLTALQLVTPSIVLYPKTTNTFLIVLCTYTTYVLYKHFANSCTQRQYVIHKLCFLYTVKSRAGARLG